MPSAKGSLDSVSVSRSRSLKLLATSIVAVSILLVIGIVYRLRTGVNVELLRQEARKAAQQRRYNDAEALLSRLAAPAPEDWLLHSIVANKLGDDD